MRQISLIGLLLVAGCNAVVTQEQARSVCESVGASESTFQEAISFAERDKSDGFSAGESMQFARGGCENICDDDASCVSDCTTCSNAVINFVFSQE